MKINLHIERLVLDGFAPDSIDGDRVRLALGAELAHLLRTTPAAAMRGSATSSAAGNPLTSADSAHAQSLGVGVARSLHGVLVGTPITPALRARTSR